MKTLVIIGLINSVIGVLSSVAAIMLLLWK